MKRFLALTLTLILAFGMTVPANAVTAGDVIYFVTEDTTLTSVTACFYEVSGELLNTYPMTLQNNGAFSVAVPVGAVDVLFVDSAFNPLNGNRATLSACAGNTYHMFTMSTGTWYNTIDGMGGAVESVSDSETTEASDPNSAHLGSGTGSATINISGILNPTPDAEEVVSVNVSWEAMEFTYTPPKTGTWDPDTHTYVGGTSEGWSSDSNSITVTNHSNVGITADFDFEAADQLELTGEFRDSEGETQTALSLSSADNGYGEGGAGAPTSGTMSFHITSGSISDETASLGTITVTISKTTDTNP